MSRFARALARASDGGGRLPTRHRRTRVGGRRGERRGVRWVPRVIFIVALVEAFAAWNGRRGEGTKMAVEAPEAVDARDGGRRARVAEIEGARAALREVRAKTDAATREASETIRALREELLAMDVGKRFGKARDGLETPEVDELNSRVGDVPELETPELERVNAAPEEKATTKVSSEVSSSEVVGPSKKERSVEDELMTVRGAPHPVMKAPTSLNGKPALDPKRIRTISLNAPRAFLYENFLSEKECEHLFALSKGKLHKSGVVDAQTGGSSLSEVRTSTGTFISRKYDDIIARVEERIELWSQIPQSHHEAFQILRYEPGQEYKAHFDYFFHKSGMRNNRIATVLLYLSDVEEGGETVFPNTDVPTSRNRSMYSECGNGGKALKARKGDALLFWSMKPGGELDAGSSHAGCPVIKGEKWTATKWMHVNPLAGPNDDAHNVFYDGGPRATASCSDAQAECRGWAESGECDKNPGFMRESCKMSCRVCVGDWRDGSYVKPEEVKSETAST